MAELYPCIVISGRAKADVMRRLNGVEVRRVVGNHGVEPWGENRAVKRQVQTWLPVLECNLSSLPGVWVENKQFSIAVHYRLAMVKRNARLKILRAVKLLVNVRLVGGKQVINVIPKGSPDKGAALERERVLLGFDKAVYVGDDETDEDVFALCCKKKILGIRVGQKLTSAASFCIKRQKDIDSLLQLLIKLRQGEKN